METIYDVNNLTFSYRQGDRKVLDGVSLQLNRGDILCVLGPNGAGKTTLLNCMAGLLKPDAGEIILCGKDLKNMKAKEIASLAGYVPQMHTPAFDYTVMDFVLMGRAPKTGTFSRPKKEDESLCMDILGSMGIGGLASKSYLEISGGERQQVLIARAIAQQPEVILFDEPTAHLDYGNQHRVLNRIKQMAGEGFSVIITTHNPDHALLLGDKAAIVSKDGHIRQGSVEDIIAAERLREVYDIDLHLEYVEEINRVACFAPELDDRK
ncbi:MAG: ABC transporter ATP-binding protein [Clostridiales bacterium]|nr:ABC transporter ATP-binding protein [Clostridiales bacterium]